MNVIHHFARECDGKTHSKINSMKHTKSCASHARSSIEDGSSFYQFQPRRLFCLSLFLAAAISFLFGTVVRNIVLYNMGTLDRALRNIDPISPAPYPAVPRTAGGGNIEVTVQDRAYYYEALVHPSMITHPLSKRVAIIGDDVSTILHEVMKHNTIEYVMVAEYGAESDDTDESSLAEWSSNSQVVLEHTSFFMEPGDVPESDKFDVIIVNTFNKGRMAEIVSVLQQERSRLANMLSDNGVFATELNGLSTIEKYSSQTNQEIDMADVMVETLQDIGFQSIHEYEGPSPSNSFLVALKEYDMRSRWYMNTAETAVELHRRLHRTKSGELALYLDSASLFSYQVPSKAQETRYCQRHEESFECEEYRGMSPEMVNVPLSHLEARKSEQGEFAGRGLFAAQDIAEGSTFDMKLGVSSFEVNPPTWFVINNFIEWADDKDTHAFASEKFASLEAFIEGYGYRATILGMTHFTIDAGITTFCNHGCNGTFSYGEDADDDEDEEDEVLITEMNADPNFAPLGLLNKAPKHSPVVERHLRQVLSIGDITLKDIKRGEEILCDYLSFIGNPADWKDEVLSLRGQCSGEAFGDITKYELKPEHDPTRIS